MKILAIETSSDACSIAIATTKIYSISQVVPQQHANLILGWIDDLLKQAGLTLSDLDAVSYSCGPGSFTGIRIAASVGQGIALAKDKPLFAVPSLQVIAQGVNRVYQGDRVMVVLNARMDQVYVGKYQIKNDGFMQPLEDVILCSLTELDENILNDSNWLVVTDMMQSLIDKISSKDLSHVISDFYPDAYDVLQITQDRFKKGELPSADHAHPIYIRNENAWKKIRT